MLRIRCHSRICKALAIGMICGLVGCQHLEPSQPKPSLSRDSSAAGGQGQSSELGGKLTPAQEADILIAFARAAERRGDLDQAMSIYRDALTRDGRRADAYVRLAVLHDRQGRFRESADLYQKALQLKPGDAEIYCDKGYSLYLQQQWPESEMILRQAIALAPDLRRAHNNLALVLTHVNRREEALAEFRRAGNDTAEAHCNLAFALTMDRQWQGAREHYKLALAAKPSSKTIQPRLQQLDALVARLEPDRSGATRDKDIKLSSAPSTIPTPTGKPTAAQPQSPARKPPQRVTEADKHPQPAP
jgi:tetratricopeptide (TPR) repeat protein